MELRDATADDATDVRTVARESLAASYDHVVETATIEEVVGEWYGDEPLEELLAGDATLFQVGAVDGEVVAFVQGATLDTEPPAGELHWLHVHPEYRDRGLGVQLLGRAQEAFRERGAEVLRGLVLEANEAGTGFYADHGFDRVDENEVAVGDQTVTEVVFEKAIGEEPTDAVVEAVDGPDGEDLYVDYSHADRGVAAPFYPVYGTADLQHRWGWFCGDCETLDNAMDAMGRIVCNTCGNERRATRWDASYL